jgi:thiamine biosynthesis lipoprotein
VTSLPPPNAVPGARRIEHIWGTVIGVDIRDDLPADRLTQTLDDAFGWFATVDEVFSTYKPTSEISRLAAGEIGIEDCGQDVGDVLRRCDALKRATGGYFDAYAGGRLDPTGLVKGWAVQRASELLVDAGAANHCINAGGDIVTRGRPDPDRRWRFGIAHPHVGDALCAVVELGDGAIATSGPAERGSLHVVDPHTGRAALDLASVTVIGADLGTADAYATAALAMGVAAPAWLADLEGHEGYVVDAGGFAWETPGFFRYRAETPDAGSQPKS